MNKSVALGLLLVAGFVAGAFIMSTTGREKPQGQDPGPVNARIDSLAGKVDSLEKSIADLNERLELTLAAIEANSESISEMKDQLAAAGRESEVAAVKDSEEKKREEMEQYSHGPNRGVHDAIDRLKEDIKKELKEENQAAKREKHAQEVKKWRDWQMWQLRNKLDDKLPGLAQKLGLDTSQELLVKSIGEEVLRKITSHWENWEGRLADAGDEDWREFKGEFGRIYEDAQRQLAGHVTEAQAKAIMRFITESDK